MVDFSLSENADMSLEDESVGRALRASLRF
jgi:hypothetical protein